LNFLERNETERLGGVGIDLICLVFFCYSFVVSWWQACLCRWCFYKGFFIARKWLHLWDRAGVVDTKIPRWCLCTDSSRPSDLIGFGWFGKAFWVQSWRAVCVYVWDGVVCVLKLCLVVPTDSLTCMRRYMLQCFLESIKGDSPLLTSNLLVYVIVVHL